MKTKLVLWGTNEKDEKLLIGMELLAAENKVRILTFPEKDVTEEFYNQMMNSWRNNNSIVMVSEPTVIDRDLKMADGLLPDELRTDRTDILDRAKTEWHFAVLSAKLYESYQSELEELKDKIQSLTEFDGNIWDEMKVFWNKVQDQARSRTLFRQHVEELKKTSNELFSNLKVLKKKVDSEFEEISTVKKKEFMEKLNSIEERISKGLGLQPIFNELKKLQAEFRDTTFTREHRGLIWQKLDAAFKTVKDKKYGAKSSNNSALDRLVRRYDGLLTAIKSMDQSIKRDKSDMEYQDSLIASSEGQLEMQIRKAKQKMVEQRIQSKIEKYDDMLKTKAELEDKIAREKVKAEKAKEKEKVEQIKEEVKSKIADEIEQTAKERSEDDEKLRKAAEAIKGIKTEESEPSTLEAISNTVGDAVEDMVDTVKAVASVAMDKVEDMIDDLTHSDEEE